MGWLCCVVRSGAWGGLDCGWWVWFGKFAFSCYFVLMVDVLCGLGLGVLRCDGFGCGVSGWFVCGFLWGFEVVYVVGCFLFGCSGWLAGALAGGLCLFGGCGSGG